MERNLQQQLGQSVEEKRTEDDVDEMQPHEGPAKKLKTNPTVPNHPFHNLRTSNVDFGIVLPIAVIFRLLGAHVLPELMHLNDNINNFEAFDTFANFFLTAAARLGRTGVSECKELEEEFETKLLEKAKLFP